MSGERLPRRAHCLRRLARRRLPRPSRRCTDCIIPGTLDHHYTIDSNEYQVLADRGWQQEGVAWDSRDSSAVPVYRLYHEGTRDHHYTKDYNEYQVLGQRGWKQEGVAWYSDEAEGVPVYRLYHEGTLNHHYTKDYNEYQVLAGRGWKQEGVAWYGVAEDTVPVSRTPIMGVSQASVEQMAAYYRKNVGESTYPASVYTNYGAPTLQDFCTIVLEEAKAEGVRAEVVFAQAMKETGWLRFGGAVKVEQCNFCGLGAVNSAPGNAASSGTSEPASAPRCSTSRRTPRRTRLRRRALTHALTLSNVGVLRCLRI